MTKKSLKAVFFGNERLATGVSTTNPALKALIEAGFDIPLVVLSNRDAVSRKSRTLEAAAVAEANNIPVLLSSNLHQELDRIKSVDAEVGVLVAFGKIIPKELIEVFPAGIVNIHPSLLPKHRGPTPIESVILNGEHETGVSVMKLSAEMDAGPVYLQSTISVPSNITKQNLCDELLKMGSKLVVQNLPAIASGSLEPTPQDHDQATYDQLINKVAGNIDWSKPATVLEREIRAYASWPKSKTKLGQHSLTITQVDVVKTSGIAGNWLIKDNELVVHCGVDSLKILRLQPENKKEMPVKAFLQGYSL